MGKKSRLKKERWEESKMYKPPPAIAELLNDYFAAEEALAEASGPIFFRG